MANFAQNHSPNSFFKTKNGRMVLDDNGCPQFTITNKESSKITWIRDFIKYVMDHSSEKELEKIVGCLGPFLGYMIGDGSTKDALKYLFDDWSDFKLVIKKYEEYKKYSGKEVSLIKDEKEYVSGYSDVNRNYSDDFYNYLIGIYDSIYNIPLFNVRNSIDSFYGQTFVSHINPWADIDGIHNEYNKANEFDEEQRFLIKQTFEKARQLDSDFAKKVSKRVEAVALLTKSFEQDFGI